MKPLNWLDRQNPLAGIAVILLTFVIAALIAAAGRPPAQPQGAARPAYILVFATAQPTALPTADTEIARLRARVAELEAARQPEPIYKVMAQEIPTPELAPQVAQPTAWTADAVIVQRESGSTVEITVPESAPRYCRGAGFGDWRDYDAKYASSPVCDARP